MPKAKKLSKPKLPKPSKFTLAMLGPGVVLIAMGLGSGEYVLWPYFVAKFGFGVLWGALVGILFQYTVSNESGRYTLAKGDSVFVGMRKLSRAFPFWFIVSTFISFAWPGIIGSAGEILGHIFSIDDFRFITISLLIVIGLLLTFGGEVYSNLERIQKLFLLISMPALIFIAALVINPEILVKLAQGLVGIGEGYLFIPEGIGLVGFLGAIAYSGAGGNLVLSHSFYVQDEGLAMAKYADSQISREKSGEFKENNFTFPMNKKNIDDFRYWFRNTAIEQFATFFTIGILSIALLSVIAYALVYPFVGEEGLEFVFLQAEEIQSLVSPAVGLFYLVVGVVFLFQTQLGVFESTSRIMSENLQLTAGRSAKVSRSKLFFIFLWAQIAAAIIITVLDIAAPLEILFLSSFFSAISMFVLSGGVLWLNSSKHLAKELQPGRIRKLMMFISFVFFGVFSLIVLAS